MPAIATLPRPGSCALRRGALARRRHHADRRPHGVPIARYSRPWAYARLAAMVVALIGSIPIARAGPPFLTDDPVPVPYRHKELYLFSTYDHGPDGKSVQAPAIEFNYGFAPDFMVHLVVPYMMFFPNFGEAGRGLGDVELGVMYRFMHETATRPAVGTFPFVEVPTGNAARGTGNGQVWYRIPVWAAKSWGSWTLTGGGGYVINHAAGARNYGFGGLMLQRVVGASLTLGGEVFTQQADTANGAAATIATFGGYFTMAFCHCQLLFDGGHTVSGAHHTIGYLGLYWTWGPP